MSRYEVVPSFTMLSILIGERLPWCVIDDGTKSILALFRNEDDAQLFKEQIENLGEELRGKK